MCPLKPFGIRKNFSQDICIPTVESPQIAGVNTRKYFLKLLWPFGGTLNNGIEKEGKRKTSFEHETEMVTIHHSQQRSADCYIKYLAFQKQLVQILFADAVESSVGASGARRVRMGRRGQRIVSLKHFGVTPPRHRARRCEHL